MNIVERIVGQFTNPAMLDYLADILRKNSQDFPEIESQYKAAVASLKERRSTESRPTVDEYIAACQTEVVANLLYAAYLGYRANLNNFHAPYTASFELLDFTDYIRDHLMGHFTVCFEANTVQNAFEETVPSDQKDLLDAIRTYYIDLDVAGPKLAHYIGYMVSNKLLPWVEPGYREDYSQTYRYTHELQKFMGYLPL